MFLLLPGCLGGPPGVMWGRGVLSSSLEQDLCDARLWCRTVGFEWQCEFGLGLHFLALGCLFSLHLGKGGPLGLTSLSSGPLLVGLGLLVGWR